MKPWSPAELRTLKQMYPEASPVAIMAATGRSWQAVRRKANDLGLKRAGHYDPNQGVMRKCRRSSD
jgi:hypothetical protein